MTALTGIYAENLETHKHAHTHTGLCARVSYFSKLPPRLQVTRWSDI